MTPISALLPVKRLQSTIGTYDVNTDLGDRIRIGDTSSKAPVRLMREVIGSVPDAWTIAGFTYGG